VKDSSVALKANSRGKDRVAYLMGLE
jgi:hypothetical protein